MNPQVLAEIAIAKTREAPKLAPGKYHVSGQAIVSIDADVSKGEPTTYTPTTHLPLKAVLAIALKKAGVQKRNIEKIVLEAATEALGNGATVGEELAVTERALKAVEKMLAKLPPQTREGATKVNGTVRVVSFKATPEVASMVA